MRPDSFWTEFISLQQQRLPSNQSCLLQSGICGTLYGNPATEPLFEEFCEVHCLKLNILCCDFARIMVISLIVLSYNVIFSFGKRKKLHRLLGIFQASLESAATCWHNSPSSPYSAGRAQICQQSDACSDCLSKCCILTQMKFTCQKPDR